MRLIDAEQIGLTDMEIILCDGNYKKVLEMLIDKIANAPSIDAVQVVRCKDCKYHEQADTGTIWCDTIGAFADEDWFCADGKREEE